MKNPADFKKSLLAALERASAPLTAWTLLESLDGAAEVELMNLDPGFPLAELVVDGMVKRVEHPGISASWMITPLGRAHVIAERNREAPSIRAQVNVTCCNARKDPAAALICMDEDELDEWWASLDVELKADAFTQFALHLHDGSHSRVHICDRVSEVPVTGVIGEESRVTA